MGFSVSWLAIRGKDADTVQRELALAGTGEYEEVPESPLLGANLAEGWYLVFANRCDYADNAPLERLSRGDLLVTCAVEEHAMISHASGWSDGRSEWSVLHDSQQGLEHLDAQGDLPPAFAAIRDRLSEEQAEQGEADYLFDVPIEVARAITGFRHDQSEPTRRFERLSDTAPADESDFLEFVIAEKKLSISPVQNIAPRKWWQIWR
jgi:hypothetical protein